MAAPIASSPRDVASPASAFIWAALWLFVAAVSTFALVSEWSAAISFEIKDQRTESFLLFTPLLALCVAILFIAFGVRRTPRYRVFLQEFQGEDRAALRRQELFGQPWIGPLSLGIVLGLVSLAALALLVTLLVRGNSPGGISVLLVVLMLFAMAAFPLLRAGIECRAVNLPSD